MRSKNTREGRRVGRKVIGNSDDELDAITNPYNKADKFLFDAAKIFLTYGTRKCPTHLDKESYIEWAESLYPDTKIKFIRLAHENGSHEGDDKLPYYHTHVLILWETAVRTKTCRRFDYYVDLDGNEICLHPNIRRISTQKHYEACCRYIGKEDPENADLLTLFVSWQENVKSCLSRVDVLELANKPQDIQGLLTAFDIYSNEKIWQKVDYSNTLSRWQRVLYNRLGETSFGTPYVAKFKLDDDSKKDWDSDESFEESGDRRIGRSVITILNTEGNAGKTWFIKNLMTKEPHRFLALQGVSQARDISSQIEQALANNWSGDTILINITRQAADYKIYNSIELCCDGLITTEKYIGKTSLWQCKNVVLFTNFMPNIAAMSKDRWEVYTIRTINSDLRKVDTNLCYDIYSAEAAKRKEIN